MRSFNPKYFVLPMSHNILNNDYSEYFSTYFSLTTFIGMEVVMFKQYKYFMLGKFLQISSCFFEILLFINVMF